MKKQEYTFKNETGDAKITVYPIFAGIEVAYISVHMDQFDFSKAGVGIREHCVEFHYCLEGRMEKEVENEFFYLMPGDCSIVMQEKQPKKFRMPLRHYHGISIVVDTEYATKNFSAFFEDESIEPVHIAKRWCKEQDARIVRSVNLWKSDFWNTHIVFENCHTDYLKIKVLELFYTLSRMDEIKIYQEASSVPRVQVELVKEVTTYLSKNLNDKVNLRDLTLRFGVSDTYLQNAFRAVYGMPVMSFLRVQKMQRAGQILIHTTKSIEEIAESFGYENESKFSSAFKKIMGDSPSVYRKEHTKMKIL